MIRHTAATVALATAALAGSALAESPTPDQPFLGTLTRADVSADLSKPFVGGNPWSSRYNMFPAKSVFTTEQVRGAYKTSRDVVRALNGEDSGSAYLATSPSMKSGTAVMGGSAAPADIERTK